MAQKNFRNLDTNTLAKFTELYLASGEENESNFFAKMVLSYANRDTTGELSSGLQAKAEEIATLTQDIELLTQTIADQSDKIASQQQTIEAIEATANEIEISKTQLYIKNNENGQIATRLQLDIDSLKARLQNAVEFPVKTIKVLQFYSVELQKRKGVEMTPAEMLNDLFIKYVKIQPSEFSFPFIVLPTFKKD
jgi:chromosome segregation ATPase